MENTTEKKRNFSKGTLKRTGILSLAAVAALLLILLCITMGMRSHIQNEYASARGEVGETLYTELYMLCQTFDQVTVPGADVQDSIIPSMRDYYLAAQALNEALVNAFGDRYGVLQPEHISALDAAFAAYDTAFRAGRATDEAQASMQSCVDMLRQLLNQRFPAGKLAAR